MEVERVEIGGEFGRDFDPIFGRKWYLDGNVWDGNFDILETED